MLTAISLPRELAKDPGNKFANFLLHSADHLDTGNKTFSSAYLWVHALIKLIAIIGILKNQLWAYRLSLFTLGVLMLYQIYSIVVRISIGMTPLTIFDVFILRLIWREYGKAKVLQDR